MFDFLILLLVLFVGGSHEQDSSNSAGYGPQLNIANATGRVALLWTSIAVAIVTSLLQGMITTIVQISEDQGLWTFR